MERKVGQKNKITYSHATSRAVFPLGRMLRTSAPFASRACEVVTGIAVGTNDKYN